MLVAVCGLSARFIQSKKGKHAAWSIEDLATFTYDGLQSSCMQAEVIQYSASPYYHVLPTQADHFWFGFHGEPS
jgi:hypothetical protein